MRNLFAFCVVFVAIFPFEVKSQEALCAEVKIEILQELTMERQGFEAQMRITNSLDSFPLENISVTVLFSDAQGRPVVATSDTSASDAPFFIRVDDTRDLSGYLEGDDGYIHSASIAPKTIGEMRWLIIPTASAPGNSKNGKLFYVGAQLKYSYNGKEEVVDVAADSIVVKPQPLLTLDYFLPEDIVGDDGFTQEIEAPEPYTLGLRITNNGFGVASNVKIESAQPKIVENKQGLAADFKIIGSYLNDQPATPSLLLNVGNIEPKSLATGRWIMETNLAGKFISFSASFTHADVLGGQLTSLIQATNAHFLVGDVLMDMPGRDNLRDFLAYSGARELYIYESNASGLSGIDCLHCEPVKEVTATLTDGALLEHPPQSGLSYAQVADPYNGTRVLAKIIRSDGKVLHPQNVWLSKKRASDNIHFNHFVNLFDNNSTGEYTVYWGVLKTDLPQAPVIQFLPNRVTYEGGEVGFIVSATDPNGTIPNLSVLQLPTGASFNLEQANQGIFQWAPSLGQAGSYLLTFAATDGELSAQRTMTIKVNPANDIDGDGMDDDWEREHFDNLDKDGTKDTDGDGRTDLQEFLDGSDPLVAEVMPTAPQILSPIFNADVLAGAVPPLLPQLAVTNGVHPDSLGAVSIVFEVYADDGLTELIGNATIEEGELQTFWQLGLEDLLESKQFNDNTRYYWRAKSIHLLGSARISSAWVKSQFFINTQNDVPTPPGLSAPLPNAVLTDSSPTLIITNSSDPDGDSLTYSFVLYEDSDLDNPIAVVDRLPPGDKGQTVWRIPKELQEDGHYLWRARATDKHGAFADSEWGYFSYSTDNAAPSEPEIVSPVVGDTNVELSASGTLLLTVKNSVDPEGVKLNYFFELDTQNTFDSLNKKISPLVPEGLENTSWQVANLVENQVYHWRVRANDGEADSAWAIGNFTLSSQNEPPSTPTILNPDNGTAVNSLRPLFEVNPAVDPEGGLVNYHFELYATPEAQTLIDQRLTSSTQWVMESDLADKLTYYWRVRAEDDKGLSSEWSPLSAFTIVLPPVNIAPEMSFVLPDQFIVDEQKQVLLQWIDSDPDSSAKIALYYENLTSGEITKLVDAIEEDQDGDGDQYLWLTQGVLPGDYKISATISDEKNSSQIHACCTVRIQQPSSVSSSAGSASSFSSSVSSNGSSSSSEFSSNSSMASAASESGTSSSVSSAASISSSEGSDSSSSVSSSGSAVSSISSQTATSSSSISSGFSSSFSLSSVASQSSISSSVSSVGVIASSQSAGSSDSSSSVSSSGSAASSRSSQSSTSSNSTSSAASSSLGSSSSGAVLICDINHDSFINTLDISAIMARRNTNAQGASDPADANNDGKIDVGDARACTLKCTKPNCAI